MKHKKKETKKERKKKKVEKIGIKSIFVNKNMCKGLFFLLIKENWRAF